jgi:hypothetical protein
MDHPERAGSQQADRVDFDRRVRLEIRGAQLSSDAGLLVMRELDDALGLSDLAATASRDHSRRSGRKTLDKLAQSGDLDVRRHATWGMSEYMCRKTLISNRLGTYNFRSCLFQLEI